MITRAYFRCCDPHYFAGGSCIYDGWSCPESARLAQAVTELRTRQQPLTLQTLTGSGLSSAVLDRTRLHDFGRVRDVFDGYMFEPATDAKTEIAYHTDLVDALLALPLFSANSADIDLARVPWYSSESPIGLYRNSPDSDTPMIALSNTAMYVQRHYVWRRLPYDSIIQMSTTEPFDGIALELDSGNNISLSVTKGDTWGVGPAVELMKFVARARSVEEWWLHSLLRTE